jgi:hypothetical protein
MTNTAAAIAESFSRHRFAETFPHLADDVRWVAVGQARRTPSNCRRSDHVPQ